MTANDNNSEKALQAFLIIPPCPDFIIEREAGQIVQERELFPCMEKDDNI